VTRRPGVATDADDVQVVDNPSEDRYEAYVDGALAGFVMYEREPGRLALLHTEVDPAFEGKGVGSKLAAGVLDNIRDHGDVIVPRCPFIAKYIAKHPEYDDIVASGA
jgi:uncharacterized protein